MNVLNHLGTAIPWMISAFYDRPLAERKVFVDQFRQHRSRRKDPLANAEIAVIDAMLSDFNRPMKPIIDQLELATQVFAVNNQPEWQAECWHLLAKWYLRAGVTAEALSCARRALAMPEININARLGLVNVVPAALSSMLCFDDATACLEHDFIPYMLAASPSPRLALAWRDAAYMQILGAARAAKLQNIFSIDLEHTIPACTDDARDLMKSGLTVAKKYLERAREIGGLDRNIQTLNSYGLIQSLEGHCDAASTTFGHQSAEGIVELTRLHNQGWNFRVNGRYAEALPYLQASLDLSQELGFSKFECIACFELSICHAALNEMKSAYLSQSRFNTLHTRAFVEVVRAGPRREWLDPGESVDTVGSTESPVPAPNALGLRRSVPPYLAQATRLIEQSIGTRLGLAEAASRVGTSPRTLQNAFAEYTGMTFMATYRQAALNEARRLLRLTGLPVAEIALRVGYKTASAFTRDFKEFCGVPPKVFRDADKSVEHASEHASL